MTESMPQLFISYAHTDNQKPDGARLGWVDRFYEGLEMELRELGIEFKFWRDRRDLEKDGFFDDDILRAVADSKVFVAVLSPVYATRSYCRKEIRHFVNHSLEGEKKNLEKVIKIIKQPFNDEATKEEIKEYFEGRIGFKFYSIDKQENRVLRYIRRNGDIAENKYWDVNLELAEAIHRQLMQEIHKPNKTSESCLTVYLAETALAEDISHRTIKAELEALGVKVLPEEGLPNKEHEVEKLVTQALEISDFSVHLLGLKQGYVPDGESELPIAELQMELAANKSKRDQSFQRLIWVNPEVGPKRIQALSFLKHLVNGETLVDSDEIINEPIELFKNSVAHTVKSRSSEHSLDRAGKTKSIYLIYHETDKEYSAEIRTAFYGRGWEVFRQELPEHLEHDPKAMNAISSQVNCIVVVYGRAREDWVQQTLLLISNSTNTANIKSKCGVLIVGEPSTTKSEFLTVSADTILHSGDFGTLEECSNALIESVACK